MEQLSENQPFYSHYVKKARRTSALGMIKGLVLITSAFRTHNIPKFNGAS